MPINKKHKRKAIRAAVTLPDPVEWDFRSVTAETFPAVAIYEYARSSKLVTDTWDAWQHSTLPALVCLAGIPDFAHDCPSGYTGDEKKTQTIKSIFDKHCPDGIPLGPRSELAPQDVIHEQLVNLFPSQLSALGLTHMLLSVPQFPAPYFKLSETAQARLNKVPLQIAESKQVAFREADPWENSCHRVFVDWSCELPAIKNDFGLWLEQKLKQQPDLKQQRKYKRTGKAAQSKYEYLKWLAAFRIKNAGIPFDVAQSLLVAARAKHKPRVAQVLCELPIFSQAPNWTDSHKKAAQLIEQMFNTVQHGNFTPTLAVPSELFLSSHK